MKKILCLILAAMLMLCGCSDEAAWSSYPENSAAGSQTSENTKTVTADNVTFRIPESCQKSNGNGNTTYYYYPDDDFIMTSINENPYPGMSMHNDNGIDAIVTGMRSNPVMKDLRYEKSYINNIPVLLIRSELSSDNNTGYICGVYMSGGNSIISISVCSLISSDTAKEKFDAFAETISITGSDS